MALDVPAALEVLVAVERTYSTVCIPGVISTD